MPSLFQVPAALHTLSHLLLTTLYLRYYYTHLIVEDLRSEKSNNLPKSHRWRVQSIRCSCQCFMLCPIVSSSGLDATTPHKSGTVISLVAQGIWGQEGKSAAKKVSIDRKVYPLPPVILHSTDIQTLYHTLGLQQKTGKTGPCPPGSTV